MSNPIVKVNCGGKLFQTYRSTLVNGSTYFRALLAGGFSESLEADLLDNNNTTTTPTTTGREYFLDLNPQAFELLLDRMRYGLNFLLPLKNRYGLIQAAEFLGVEYRNPDEINKAEEEARKKQLTDSGIIGYEAWYKKDNMYTSRVRVIDLVVTSETGEENLVCVYVHKHPATEENLYIPLKQASVLLQDISKFEAHQCLCGYSACPNGPMQRATGGHNIALGVRAGSDYSQGQSTICIGTSGPIPISNSTRSSVSSSSRGSYIPVTGPLMTASVISSNAASSFSVT